MQEQGRIKLLVVDDTDDVRALVAINAELDGRFGPILEAIDAAGAVAAAAGDPDIGAVALDNVMPDRDGVDVLPELRRLLPSARIVLYTSDQELALRAVDLGADAALPKHIPLATLIDALAQGERG